MTTAEGFHWTPSTGLQQGLPTAAVLPSSTNTPTEYDVIVIGAGYAGLVAARDLALQQFKVLLLEARDRIGGRTWTSNIDGFNYEMGGTWISWKQPHVYTELSRYGMKDQLTYSPDYTSGINCFSMNLHGQGRDVSHQEEDALYTSMLTKFFNIDGQLGRSVMPFPHDPFHNSAAAKQWDQVTLQDRLDQLRGTLTDEEATLMTNLAVHMSGGTVANTGFFDLLRWWALCDYTPTGINEYGLAVKLKCGQTELARQIYLHAHETNNLTTLFSSPVMHIDTTNHISPAVTITTATATTTTNPQSSTATYTARTIISTLPLNVLNHTTFNPPLPDLKRTASTKGHIDHAPKIHYELPTPNLKSWSGTAWPGKGLLFAYGDGTPTDPTTGAQNTHIVAFGASDVPLFSNSNPNSIDSNMDGVIPATLSALDGLLPSSLSEKDREVKRVVFHDWSADPWARGAWCMLSAGFASEYLDALREDHGGVVFASADWAHGWRGFIDGAIEQGQNAAFRVGRRLRRRERERGKVVNGVV